MQSQVLKACDIGIIDTSFIGLDSTPIHANTSHNNPKSFKKNKFKDGKEAEKYSPDNIMEKFYRQIDK